MSTRLISRLKKHGLSKRELEVFELVGQALTNLEVGQELGLAEKTIKYHVTNIFKKLEMDRRTEIVVMANTL